MLQVRPPAVAGTFYPADAAALRAQVEGHLAAAATTATAIPKALVAPHAGYVYSGPVAGTAYAAIAPLRGRVRRVVLLGPTHRVAVRGLALPGADRFRTPLGEVEIDAEAVAKLAPLPQVITSAAAHAQEHSLEVHLPFLQATLGEFRLVPLTVGNATADEVAEVLETLWGGEETLVIVSSDLSHYLPHAAATRTDRDTVDDILRLDPHLDHGQACGATPLNGLLLVSRRRHLRPMLLDLRTSGDTAGDRDRVVGYASIAFLEDGVSSDPDTGDDRGRAMLRIARAAIGRQLGLAMPAPKAAPFLQAPGAVFVTLTRDGALRGCIGSLQAHRPLWEDIEKNARSAAFLDPRFPPVSLREFDRLTVEVSLLSPPEPVSFQDRADLLAQLRPGIDGVILDGDGHRGTFLPQVWESLPAPAQFLAQLLRKAGLPDDFPVARLHVSRYGVEKWSEADPR